jgi:hypothetical protein
MMEMYPLSHSKMQVPQTGGAANEDPSNGEAKIDICDTVAFTPRDLSPRGTLTLIIQIKDGGECSPFIEEYKKCGLGQFKEELDVINASPLKLSHQT